MSNAGRFGDGGGSAAEGGSAGAAGNAGSGSGGSHAGSGGNGGSATGGAGGSGVVDEYPVPRAAYSRYFEGGINADTGLRSHAVTQPETSASSGLWLKSSSLQFYRASLDVRIAFWAGEVKNFGTEPVCDVTIKVAFRQDHVDAEPRHVTSAKLEGEQRVAAGGARVWCVMPGTIVPAYAAPPIAQDLFGGKMDVAEVTWQIDGTSDAAPDPLMPTIVLEKLNGQGVAWGVQAQFKGSAAGATQMLHHSAYLSFGDFLEFPITASHPEPLAPDEEWNIYAGPLTAPANTKARFRSSLSFEPVP